MRCDKCRKVDTKKGILHYFKFHANCTVLLCTACIIDIVADWFNDDDAKEHTS